VTAALPATRKDALREYPTIIGTLECPTMESETNPERPTAHDGKLIRRFDLAATAVFAIEGAAVAGGAHLDLFGVVVLGCVTAVGGGILRDLTKGEVGTQRGGPIPPRGGRAGAGPGRSRRLALRELR
jgi:hypothetical protein